MVPVKIFVIYKNLLFDRYLNVLFYVDTLAHRIAPHHM